MRVRVLIAVLVAAAPRLAAQTAVFLRPIEARVEAGQPLRLAVAEGADAEAAAWPSERLRHFFVRSAWTQENRDDVATDDEGLVPWPTDRPGVLVLGVDLGPREIEVDAAAFQAFVERGLTATKRGALGPLPAEGTVRVRELASAKALVRVDDAGGAVSVATSKTGQAVELRPLMDPTSLRPGSDAAVKFYAGTLGGAGAVVIATNATTGEVVRAVTDEEALANLTLENAGRWRLECCAIAPRDDGVPGWEVAIATLTFDMEPEEPK